MLCAAVALRSVRVRAAKWNNTAQNPVRQSDWVLHVCIHSNVLKLNWESTPACMLFWFWTILSGVSVLGWVAPQQFHVDSRDVTTLCDVSIEWECRHNGSHLSLWSKYYTKCCGISRSRSTISLLCPTPRPRSIYEMSCPNVEYIEPCHVSHFECRYIPHAR